MKKKVIFITGVLFILMAFINILINSDIITVVLYFLAGILFFRSYYIIEENKWIIGLQEIT